MVCMGLYPPIVYPDNHGDTHKELYVIVVEILLAFEEGREVIGVKGLATVFFSFSHAGV